MTLIIKAYVKSPTFTNKRLNANISVRGIPGPAGPSFDRNFNAGSVVITGATQIDINDATTIPANALMGSVTLTSGNATENISQIANMVEGVPVRFFSEPGLIVNYVSNDEDIAGTGDALQPRCQGGVNVQVNGDYNEWIEFTKLNGIISQTNAGIYTT